MAGLRVAIAGGGIGGFVLPLGLRERGVDVEVHEQAVALSANEVRRRDERFADPYGDFAWIHGHDVRAAEAVR